MFVITLPKASVFLLGISAVHLLPALPTAGITGCALIAAFAVAICLRWYLLVWCIVGVAWAYGHAVARLAQDLDPLLEGRDLPVTGYVASMPESTGEGVQFRFDVDRAAAVGMALPDLLELTWYEPDAQIAAGEKWYLTVRLRRRRGYANPGGYDYEAQLFREGIGATGYVRVASDHRLIAQPGWRYPLVRMRAYLATRLEQAVAHSPMLGVVQGLAIGERSRITPRQWQVFANTGTSHLVAISGLHIVMVAAMTAFVAGACGRYAGLQQRRGTIVDVRMLGGLAGALTYACLAGFEVPAQRTVVMLTALLLAKWMRRSTTATQGLALSIVAVLCIDPFAPLSIGAWLSFGAVAAIAGLFAGRLSEMRRVSTLRERLLTFLRTQGAVTVGLLPLLFVLFGAVSLSAPLVNLAAIPFFTLVVVPLVLVGTLLLLIASPLGAALLGVAAFLLEGAWPLLESAALLPQTIWYPAQPPVWAVVLLVLGVAVLLAPGFLATRIAGCMLCLPAILFEPATPRPGEFAVNVLDVGQGLAVVIRTHAHTLLYDAGPRFRSGRDTGELVVLPFLRNQGVRHLDALLVSHDDADHRGGVASVLAAMRVDRVLAMSSAGIAATSPCARDDRWEWDGVRFEILHPPASAATHLVRNNESCVLEIDSPYGSALLPGDIEKAAEALLLEKLRPVDVVVAPHHGSRTSSTAEFVAATRPRFVIFATGYRNRWGFPRADVRERWEAAGATTFTSPGSGAIEILVGRAGVQPPVEYRKVYRRYWHTPERVNGDQ